MSVRRPVGSTGYSILVVDDQDETLESVRMLLEREGHRVLTAASGAEAITILAHERMALMLVDYFMPVMNGEELIRQVRGRDQLMQIVLQTGYAGEKPPREMLRCLDIHGYHDKGDGPERLLLWVDVALKAYDRLAALDAAERMKTELLANVSHEFRTPLNVLVGYIDLLREGAFGVCAAEAQPAFDKLRANARYLIDLVDEFLDLSKIEAGAMPVRPEPIELGALLGELGEAFALLLRGKPLDLRVSVAPNLPPAFAERAKLRAIVQNLLSNAVKFTERGQIGVSAVTAADGRIAIAVRDTGPGIPAEHHEAIFDMFHQLNPHDGARRGIGLGLALARRFARMMGGDVVVQSDVGGGSTFTVLLPAAPRGANLQRRAAA